MNVIGAFNDTMMAALVTCGVDRKDLTLSAVSLERPKSAVHGELATNAAIVCAKYLNRTPREVAEQLKIQLETDERIKSIQIAGPGFLNFVFKPGFWTENLRVTISLGQDYGRSQKGEGRRVLLEFVSANPTGPLHVGHARGAIFGDALARLLEFTGYQVFREYYLNDGGAQVDTLGRSVYLRYLEAIGYKVEFTNEHYGGTYLKEVGESLAGRFGKKFVNQPESVWLAEFKRFAIDRMTACIRQDLAQLNVQMDAFFSETTLIDSGAIEQTLDELRCRGLIYEGVLPPPKGAVQEDWEPREQALFRSTLHGDDVDRPVLKADGSWTYFAADLAYHYNKVTRGFDELINVFGADHGGYVKRIRAAVSALSEGKTPIDIKLTQLVRVIKDGGAQKMSKRAGEFVQLREAVEAVGTDVTRFTMLMRKNDAQLDFDFDKVREQSKDNPVFYVQYAHARICSALAYAVESGLIVDSNDNSLKTADLSLLIHPAQIALARRVSEWPRIVDQASRHHEPHRIAFYLNELASDLHSYWTLGNREKQLRLIQEKDAEGTKARLTLVRAVAVVISTGLGILGVEPMTEMRD